MRFKGKNPARVKNIGRFQRPHQTFSGMPAQQTQYAPSNTSQMAPTTSTQPRKILINPHFRGLRLPPPTSDQVHTIEETPQVSVPPVSYETSQNFPPPTYSHELPPQMPAAPPVFSTPPPSVPYKQPDYSSSHIQQPPPSMWPTTPDMTPNTYTAPPPVLNYTDHLTQVPPNYHSNYTLNNFPTTSYQSTPVPLPQTVNYSQMPPPIHVQSSSYAPPPVVSAPPTYVTAMHYSNNQQRSQELNFHQYHDHGKAQHSTTQHIQRNKFSQNQRFSRPEKRPSNSNIKAVPIKQLRMEHPQKKTNIHVNNSNIREIPLVDTLPSTTVKEEVKKPVPIVEEEDEKTKELRMKIEEQKLLRAQILKHKEERRRQMAAQRLLELKKRQAEQNKNIVTITQKPEQQNLIKVPQAQVALQTKISVKERIGLPPNKTAVPMKKKIIVVRKKVPPVSNTAAVPPEAKNIPNVGQKRGLQTVTQSQKMQLQNKTAGMKPNKVSKPSVVSTQPVQDSSVQKNLPENKSETAKPEMKVNVVANEKKCNQVASQPPKGKMIRLPTRRQPFQRPPFHAPLNIPNQRMPGPRFAGPRGPQFHSPPFMEHRMRFPGHGPPMNDMRMPPPPFQEPRPPILPYMPPGERGPFNQFFPPDGPFEGNKPPFRMRAPGFQNFPPRSMDMFRERFPPPQFPNQMPPMRQMFERNGPGFQRPRFQNLNAKKKPLPAKPIPNQQKPSNGYKSTQPKELSVASDSQVVANQNTAPKQVITLTTKSSEEKQVIKLNTKSVLSENLNIPKTQSVSVENLSSSTNEMQLKKLCSSVGVVENIQLLKAERKAIIKFKEPIQALNFQKKYQRLCSTERQMLWPSLPSHSNIQASKITCCGVEIII
ncbi:RNA-binding protein 33-like isoform X2 [Stegodyphus dumicola]|uniref:RNA-binding protein 33-like isoform X2 n=1 Tax=Stegodyphus dumicola TaxID=202533 RepID=UPI0015ACE557|nr:RNA-binding protein 33-like isoform X2 [Stegodyphus dumicola]